MIYIYKVYIYLINVYYIDRYQYNILICLCRASLLLHREKLNAYLTMKQGSLDFSNEKLSPFFFFLFNFFPPERSREIGNWNLQNFCWCVGEIAFEGVCSQAYLWLFLSPDGFKLKLAPLAYTERAAQDVLCKLAGGQNRRLVSDSLSSRKIRSGRQSRECNAQSIE